MTDLLQHLGMGFAVALTPVNLLYCLVGVVVGTAIGVLPGIGPVTTVAMLVPLTFGMNPTAALIMLAGIYYGSQYGGSTTAILINTPGETSSVMTCLDGYQMTRQGRAGPALGMAAIGSFVAGTASVVLLMLLARPLIRVALEFGPAEYFAIMVLGAPDARRAHGGVGRQGTPHGRIRPPPGDHRRRPHDGDCRASRSACRACSTGSSSCR